MSNVSLRRVSLASLAGLAILLMVVATTGCHNHRNRTHPIVVEDAGDPYDVNDDGVVDELDLDALRCFLFPDNCGPELPDCELGFFDLDDLFERLCFENRCGSKCKRDKPRPHARPDCGDYDDDN